MVYRVHGQLQERDIFTCGFFVKTQLRNKPASLDRGESSMGVDRWIRTGDNFVSGVSNQMELDLSIPPE
jgi:hypothetical protein